MKQFLLVGLILISLRSFSQCPSQEFINGSVTDMKAEVLQTFAINIVSKKDNKAKNKDLELFLTKGITYEFVIFSNKEYEGELVMSLFDSRDHVLACTYNETSRVRNKKFRFTCRTTGSYTLSYYPDHNTYCGLILLGSAKKVSK